MSDTATDHGQGCRFGTFVLPVAPAMLILALDTSTYVGTVALTRGGELLAEWSAFVRASHGETVLPHVERVLSAAGVTLGELDLIATGIGPGSFTGVRIGVATAKGLALAKQKPIVGVSSLRILASGMGAGQGVLVPLIDAHKGEVYTAAYELDEHAELREVVPPFHAPPEQAARLLCERTSGPIWVAGNGLARYGEALTQGFGARARRLPAHCDVPRGACLAHQAELQFKAHGPDDLAKLEPMYLRPSDAKLPGGVALPPSDA